MIISRTPLRISIGGGGTDLPSYYEQHTGFVISAAIDRYVYISINRTFTDDYFLKYSALERVRAVDDIQHPIIREALRIHAPGPSLEIVSVADIPAGTGLGSSGTFTVGLLRALYALKRTPVTAGALAEEACRIEMDYLKRPVGKQDQFIAAFGGITCFEFQPGGGVRVSPLSIANKTLHALEERLVMFFTGYSHEAGAVLEDQKTRSERGDREMLENLHVTKRLGLETKAVLEAGDVAGYGKLMHEHWLRKRARSHGMSNPRIDQWYELGLANGAVGGKLVGAGGGGFLVFLAEDADALREAMATAGLPEVRFTFDHDGATILVRD